MISAQLDPSSDEPPDSTPALERLVPAAVAGDKDARDLLLSEIQPIVVRYCRGRLGRSETVIGSADDVAQDVCLAVISALPHYEIKGLSFRAFVYGIAAHHVTDAFRAIGRNRTDPVAELPDAPILHDSPEQRVLAAELAECLGRLLHRFTPRQRELLVLRISIGLSAEETAQVIGSTPGAARVTQHRALSRLRAVLGGTLDVDLEDPQEESADPEKLIRDVPEAAASVAEQSGHSHNAYVDAVASRLDLAAGLGEVHDRSSHNNYVAELRHRLDLEVGLSAVRHRTEAERPSA